MSDSIEELATTLDDHAREFAECGWSTEAADLRAAALKLRECREALTYIAETRDCYHDKPDSESQQAYFGQTCGVCRAAKALEAK